MAEQQKPDIFEGYLSRSKFTSAPFERQWQSASMTSTILSASGTSVCSNAQAVARWLMSAPSRCW